MNDLLSVLTQLLNRAIYQQPSGPFVAIPEQLYLGTVTTGTTTLYTAPSANTVENEVGLTPRVRIKSLLYINLANASKVLTVYLVPSGGTASDANAITRSTTLTANEYRFQTNLDIIMPAGSTIQAIADANSSINVCINGEILYTP